MESTESLLMNNPNANLMTLSLYSNISSTLGYLLKRFLNTNGAADDLKYCIFFGTVDMNLLRFQKKGEMITKNNNKFI